MNYIQNKLNNIQQLFNRNKTTTTSSTNQQAVIIPSSNKGLTADQQVSSVATCAKILSENIARIPIQVFDKNNKVIEHQLSEILGYKPNNFNNIVKFLGRCENIRLTRGDSFVLIKRNNHGLITALDQLEANSLINYYPIDNELYLAFRTANGNIIVNYNDVLHFNQHGNNYHGNSILKHFNNEQNIQHKALSTLNNFYENNAFSPLVAESDVDVANYEATKKIIKDIINEYGGYNNAGKIIPLPNKVKLHQLNLSFADSQTVETMQVMANQLTSAFGVPNWMTSSEDSTQSIEQQTLAFKTFTLAPIIAMYEAELNFKLLTYKEFKAGLRIKFNTDILIENDMKSKVDCWVAMKNNGLCTANEAIKKFGNEPITESGDGVNYGDLNFQQIQNQAIQDYDKINLFKNGNKIDNE